MGERDPFRHQPVEVRRSDVLIAKGVDRVVPLVFCADPEDVWVSGHGLVP